jgi:ElaB/YqjD/DUF883 family membrane-anchored ribosome-binding protein
MSNEFSPNAPGTSSGFGDRVSGVAADAKARAAELGRKTVNAADQARSSAASGLSGAADAVDDKADDIGAQAAGGTRRAARALSASADYVRDTSVRDMMGDAMDVVKNNPGVALLSAAAVGFLVARALSSRD